MNSLEELDDVRACGRSWHASALVRMTAMQSYWMQMTNTETVLDLRDTPVPTPGPAQLLVRMHAAALNRGEFVLGHGLHGKAGTWKAIGGEGAGEVVAVGAQVTGFKPGDRVMGRCTGAFSEYALMEAARRLPRRLACRGKKPRASADVPRVVRHAGAARPAQGRRMAADQRRLVRRRRGLAAAGKVLGAKVIGTSGSAAKLEALKPLGLDIGLCTRSGDFASAVMEATGQHGADLIVNAVGGSVFAENIRAMAFEGRLATVGYVDGVLHAALDLGALHAKRLTLFGVSNKLRTKEQRAAAVPRFVADVMPHVAAGRIKPQIDEVIDFARLKEGKARMEAGGHVGKIVLRMPVAA